MADRVPSNISLEITDEERTRVANERANAASQAAELERRRPLEEAWERIYQPGANEDDVASVRTRWLLIAERLRDFTKRARDAGFGERIDAMVRETAGSDTEWAWRFVSGASDYSVEKLAEIMNERESLEAFPRWPFVFKDCLREQFFVDPPVAPPTEAKPAEPQENPPPSGYEAGGGAGEAYVEQSAEAAFVFRPDGDGYFLKGFGEQGHFTAKGAKGLHDLFRLVQTPRVPVPMLELDAGPGVNRAEGDGQSRQPVADGETFKQLAAKRKQLKADIASAGSDMERAELETELAELDETAKRMRGLNGKPRDLNNPNDGLRSTIHKRLKRVYDKLRKRMPRLVEHFDLSCGASDGDCFVYKPAALKMTWETDAE